MKKIIKRIITGARQHPGNIYYLLLTFIFIVIPFERFKLIGSLAGFIVFLIIFGPLYLITSYQGGKENENQTTDKQSNRKT